MPLLGLTAKGYLSFKERLSSYLEKIDRLENIDLSNDGANYNGSAKGRNWSTTMLLEDALKKINAVASPALQSSISPLLGFIAISHTEIPKLNTAQINKYYADVQSCLNSLGTPASKDENDVIKAIYLLLKIQKKDIKSLVQGRLIRQFISEEQIDALLFLCENKFNPTLGPVEHVELPAPAKIPDVDELDEPDEAQDITALKTKITAFTLQLAKAQDELVKQRIQCIEKLKSLRALEQFNNELNHYKNNFDDFWERYNTPEKFTDLLNLLNVKNPDKEDMQQEYLDRMTNGYLPRLLRNIPWLSTKQITFENIQLKLNAAIENHYQGSSLPYQAEQQPDANVTKLISELEQTKDNLDKTIAEVVNLQGIVKEKSTKLTARESLEKVKAALTNFVETKSWSSWFARMISSAYRDCYDKAKSLLQSPKFDLTNLYFMKAPDRKATPVYQDKTYQAFLKSCNTFFYPPTDSATTTPAATAEIAPSVSKP